MWKVGSEENSFRLQHLFSCIPALKSRPVLAFFLVSFVVHCTCWLWENSFLCYEMCCVLWVTWPSYLRQYLKEFHRLLCDNALQSLSKQTNGARLHTWHVVVGPKHIQGSELLTENTIEFSPSWLSFNQLTKTWLYTSHKHQYTPHMGMPPKAPTVAMTSHRGPPWTCVVKHVDVFIFCR